MNRFPKRVTELASGIMFGAIIGAILGLLVAKPLHEDIAFLETQVQYYSDKYDYYFDGANSRGYLDICRGKVLFKDEC